MTVTSSLSDLMTWMRAVEEIPTRVRIHDQTGQHRIFGRLREGLRVGHNRTGLIIWTVCVRVQGTMYLVPPAWVQADSDAPSNVVAFPGKRQ